MDIAIIGAGRVGTALGAGWLRAGHSVRFGVREPGSPVAGAPTLSPAEAAAGAEVVVLALPWGAAEGAVRALGALQGKTVIDCMNPLGPVPGGMGLLVGHDASAAEIVQGWLPEAHVVKTLNQVGAEVMADTSGFAHPPVQFLAGNDAGAKEKAARLLADLGFEPLDAGDLAKARLIEPFAMVWINQALMRGKGRDWAFAALPRKGRK